MPAIRCLLRLGPKPDALIVAFASAFFAMAGLFRGWLIWQTGVIVSDEYGYLTSAWTGQISNAVIGDRQVFAAINVGTFDVLHVSGITRAVVVLPFYIAFWGFVTLVSLWMTLRLLGYTRAVVSVSVLVLATTPTFFFVSMGFFTEPMAIAIAAMGIYFLIRTLLRASVPSAVVTAALFYGAMHIREPFSVLLLSAWFVALLGVFTARPRRKKLVACVVVLALAASVTYYPLNDPVTVQVVDIGIMGIQHALGVAQPVRSSTNTTVTITRTVSNTTTTITTTLSQATSKSTSTFTRTGSGGTQSQGAPNGILGLIGFVAIPSNSVLRVALLTVLAFITGYGPMLLLLVPAVPYLAYMLVIRNAPRRRALLMLLAALLLSTVVGSVALFIGQPSYFSTQHYSTLLRFADTGALAIPLLAAPLASRSAKSKHGIAILLLLVFVPYVVALPVAVSYTSTNLVASQNPLRLTPPPGPTGAGIYVRDFVFAHQGMLPVLVVGLRGGEFIPGLADYPGVLYSNYLGLPSLGNVSQSQILLYSSVSGLQSLEANYHVMWNFVNGALNGTRVVAGGFQVQSVVYRSDSDLLVELSRA
jgi:hypothetical protein